MTPRYPHVQASFGRCITKPGFIERIHAHYAATTPIPDGGDHKQALGLGLNLAVVLSSGGPATPDTVARLRRSHLKGSGGLDALQDPRWMESLLHALQEYDPEYQAEVEREWRAVLTRARDHLAAALTPPDP